MNLTSFAGKPDRDGRPVHIRVFAEAEIRPGVLLVISVTNDRVHVRKERAGCRKLLSDFRFALGRELDILERAIAMSRTVRSATNAGRIATKFGVTIEVGATDGAVLLRLVLPNGDDRGHTAISGAPLASLALAVGEFRKSIAASAASL